MCSKRELPQDSAQLLFGTFESLLIYGWLAIPAREGCRTLVLSGTREICDQAIQSCETTERTTGPPAQESAPARARRGKRLAPSRLERMRVITYLSTINIYMGCAGSSANTLRKIPMKTSTSRSEMISGGRSLMTLLKGPSVPVRTPHSRSRFTTYP